MADSSSTSLCQSFDHDGYLALRGFVSGSALTDLHANVARFIAEVLPSLPAQHVFYEDKENPATLKQIQQMHQRDAWFQQLAGDGVFPQLAEQLLGAPVVIRNLQYFNKPPGIGKPTPAHQDGYYFKLEPCEALTMWLALDDADEENGCVRYARGSHKLGMRHHARTSTLGFSQGITGYPQSADTAVETALHARPGDLLAHHAMTIHRAGANPSPRNRRSLGFIYYSVNACEDIAAHAAYQQQLARDMKARGQI